jgi:hypothetical protein
LNNLSNVTVHSCAIGKTEGRGKLEKLNDKNTGSTRVNSAEPGEIIIRPLTNYVNGDIDLIKIDVEGMGAEVLAGALTILRLQKPILIIECGNRKEYDEVAKILLPLQYRPVKRFNHTPTIIFEHNPEPSKFPEYQEALLMT